jgi:1-deoxy-D-xylulose-5-phosphate reductoisomerase
MVKNIAILGSTGSIGVQTLEVAKNLGIRVSGLSAGSNIELLEKQAREFRPRAVSVGDAGLARELGRRLRGLGIEVMSGVDGLKGIASLEEADTVVTSIVGTAGLIPTLEAVRSGKDIALANKETLVTAGAFVMSEARRRNVRIFPVDSEHSAVFQCLQGNRHGDVEAIILTASGGPFRGWKPEELEGVTVAQALKHPNWKMGGKITIDSATLMNKGLEVIEASWLFDMEAERIKVLVHPQSIIHSMVEYADGVVMAQLGPPDMRMPIQLALTWPERAENCFSRLDLLKCGSLTFEEPDTSAFPCLRLAYEALKAGGTMPAAMNAANEAAVGLFIEGRIRFTDIPRIIEKVMHKHIVNTNPVLNDIIEVDRWARTMAGGIK